MALLMYPPPDNWGGTLSHCHLCWPLAGLNLVWTWDINLGGFFYGPVTVYCWPVTIYCWIFKKKMLKMPCFFVVFSQKEKKTPNNPLGGWSKDTKNREVLFSGGVLFHSQLFLVVPNFSHWLNLVPMHNSSLAFSPSGCPGHPTFSWGSPLGLDASQGPSLGLCSLLHPPTKNLMIALINF